MLHKSSKLGELKYLENNLVSTICHGHHWGKCNGFIRSQNTDILVWHKATCVEHPQMWTELSSIVIEVRLLVWWLNAYSQTFNIKYNQNQWKKN